MEGNVPLRISGDGILRTTEILDREKVPESAEGIVSVSRWLSIISRSKMELGNLYRLY